MSCVCGRAGLIEFGQAVSCPLIAASPNDALPQAEQENLMSLITTSTQADGKRFNNSFQKVSSTGVSPSAEPIVAVRSLPTLELPPVMLKGVGLRNRLNGLSCRIQ